MNRRTWCSLMPLAILLQSCAVMNYKLRNQLDLPSPPDIQKREVKYAISVNGQPVWATLRKPEVEGHELEELRVKYRKATQQVFDKEGTASTYVKKRSEATFLIDIMATPYSGSTSVYPGLWLSGMTLYLIPGRGTDPNEHSYTFEEIGIKKAHSYYADLTTYTHWVFLPAFWVSYITANEERTYQSALRNYLQNTPPAKPVSVEPAPENSRFMSEGKCEYYLFEGDESLEMGHWGKSERAYRRAMVQVEGGRLSPEYRSRTLQGLGHVKMAMNDYDVAVRFYSEALEAETEASPDTIQILGNISIALYELEKTARAEITTIEILEISGELHNSDSRLVMENLTDLAHKYSKQGRVEEGYRLMHRIYEVYSQHANRLKLQEKKELKQVFSDYAAEFRELGQDQKAEELESLAAKISLERQTSALQKNSEE